jgi:filamentous hemagglutinin
MPNNISQIKHIMREDDGHLIDSPENRKKLIDLTNDKKCFVGIDEHGKEWYSKILNDGTQLWACTKNNIIQNGGLNFKPLKYVYGKGLKTHTIKLRRKKNEN